MEQTKDSLALIQNEQDIFDSFDTAKKSIILKWLAPKDVRENISFPKYLLIYVAFATLSWILPLIIAAFTQPSLIQRNKDLILPFLLDINIALMSLIAIPILVILLIRERRQIPDALSTLHKTKIIIFKTETEEEFKKKWENLFANANVFAQIFGLIISGMAIAINAIGGPVTDYYGKLWQTYEPLFFHHNLAGWFYLLFQIGLFYFLTGQIIVREIYIVRLFFDLTKKCVLDIKPLHPDRVGGLKSIASLGLNYQFTVALMGVNLGTMVITSRIIGVGEQTSLIVAALLFYCLAAPLVFVGPLIPFRIHMLKSKHDMLLRVSRRFELQIEDTLGNVDKGTLENDEI